MSGGQASVSEVFTINRLRDMIAVYLPPDRIPRRIRIITDTSDFFRVDYDDVVVLEATPFLIRNFEREGRFGIDDEPKFWVKRAIDLTNGKVKIIKLVFSERFRARAGDITFDCVRSPKKEARILKMVRGHPHFMQGYGIRDTAGNIVRIIDYIHGRTMADIAEQGAANHEEYFSRIFPAVLDDYIKLVEAISFLHDRGEKHGDIRRDHIRWDARGGTYRWIDFDFNFTHRENMFRYDLFGLGNILVFLAGGGDITVHDLKKYNQHVFDRIIKDDLNIIFNNRVVNLSKIYPYIPKALNIMMLHFSVGANVFYDNTGQFLADLHEVRDILYGS